MVFNQLLQGSQMEDEVREKGMTTVLLEKFSDNTSTVRD